MKAVLGMSFITFSNVNVQFAEKSSLKKLTPPKKLYQLGTESNLLTQKNLQKQYLIRIPRL